LSHQLAQDPLLSQLQNSWVGADIDVPVAHIADQLLAIATPQLKIYRAVDTFAADDRAIQR
jgi:hypothetical protein